MSNLIKSLGLSLSIYKKDKWVTILSLIPVIIGVLFFSIAGKYAYSEALAYGEKLIKEYFSSGTMNTILYSILAGILTVAVYFLVSYTFVLIVSIFSSPFNDMISTRVEAVIIGKDNETISATFKNSFSKIAHVLKNEVKKVIFILVMTLLSLTISFIPVLSIVSIILSAILLSVSFLDYSWARHYLSFSQCLADIRSNLIAYTLAGGGFLFLISIPVVNIFAFSFGVNYFTCLFTNKNKDRIMKKENLDEEVLA